VIYSSDGKAEFSASLLLSSVSHDPSCRNHSSIMIKKKVLRDHVILKTGVMMLKIQLNTYFLLLSMLKTVVMLVMTFFCSGFFDE